MITLLAAHVIMVLLLVGAILYSFKEGV